MLLVHISSVWLKAVLSVANTLDACFLPVDVQSAECRIRREMKNDRGHVRGTDDGPHWKTNKVETNEQ